MLPGKNFAVVNWKTFISGSLMLLAYLVFNLFVPLLNGEPVDFSTVANVEVIVLVGMLGQFLMGLSGRDADKSSQDSGVRPPVKAEAVADSTADAAIDQATR